jgi:hypothetical protein
MSSSAVASKRQMRRANGLAARLACGEKAGVAAVTAGEVKVEAYLCYAARRA